MKIAEENFGYEPERRTILIDADPHRPKKEKNFYLYFNQIAVTKTLLHKDLIHLILFFH